MFRPKINEKVVTRPPHDHPNPSHWELIRGQALERDGFACRCCPNDSTSGVALEVHHRHYDNWGKEHLDDVVTLCVICHDAITSRIRITTEYPVAPPDPVPRPERPTVGTPIVTVQGTLERRERPDLPSVRTAAVSVESLPRTTGLPPRDKPVR